MSAAHRSTTKAQHRAGKRSVKASGSTIRNGRCSGTRRRGTRYEDVDVHPHVVRFLLLRTPDIADYQVQQTARGIDVHVIAAPPPLGPHAAPHRGPRKAGLARPDVRVQAGENLPRHPQTGKLRRYLPLPPREPSDDDYCSRAEEASPPNAEELAVALARGYFGEPTSSRYRDDRILVDWGEHLRGGVAALAVVERLDVLEHGGLQLEPRRPRLAVDEFFLDGREE